MRKTRFMSTHTYIHRVPVEHQNWQANEHANGQEGAYNQIDDIGTAITRDIWIGGQTVLVGDSFTVVQTEYRQSARQIYEIRQVHTEKFHSVISRHQLSIGIKSSSLPEQD